MAKLTKIKWHYADYNEDHLCYYLLFVLSNFFFFSYLVTSFSDSHCFLKKKKSSTLPEFNVAFQPCLL